ncbi:uncharacterized protein METZ01_LOCUS164839 [marine metagenome]|uniref:YvlB/LiaX N-terminal domain-containing protein n=1 Tax=marine metagenome TaxID=408172 RepID=A0A382BDT9_9ZZZZ
MTENRRQILDMLSEGKISVEEAESLLGLLERPASVATSGSDTGEGRKSPPKYLRVVVEEDGESANEQVNVRVPMALIRSGVKLGVLIPSDATNRMNEKLREKGIDVGNLKSENLDQLVDALADMEVDVQDGNGHVRVFVE